MFFLKDTIFYLKNLLKNRQGESKFGKHIQLLSNFNTIYEDIVNLDVSYVILGIKEDMGVFANYEKTGTSKATIFELVIDKKCKLR